MYFFFIFKWKKLVSSFFFVVLNISSRIKQKETFYTIIPFLVFVCLVVLRIWFQVVWFRNGIYSWVGAIDLALRDKNKRKKWEWDDKKINKEKKSYSKRLVWAPVLMTVCMCGSFFSSRKYNNFIILFSVYCKYLYIRVCVCVHVYVFYMLPFHLTVVFSFF